MKKLFIYILMLIGAVSANAQTNDGAVYLTTPEKDTVAVNIIAKPTIKKVGTDLVLTVGDKTIKAIPIGTTGIKLTFGKELLMGDANRDEKVDIEDAKLIVDDYLGKETNIDSNSADINLDGKVDMQDANIVVNKIAK